MNVNKDNEHENSGVNNNIEKEEREEKEKREKIFLIVDKKSEKKDENDNNLKTRKWGYLNLKNKKKSTQTVKKNNFPKYASIFFYNLLPKSFFSSSNVKTVYENPSEKMIDVFQLDFILLGRLIFVLSFFIKCFGIQDSHDKKKTFQEFFSLVVFLRFHKEAFVRRNCIYSVGSILSNFSDDVLIDDFFDQLQETYDWFQLLSQNDSDEECRMMISLFSDRLVNLLNKRRNQLIYF